mgnify:CR=1 FL=1
MSKTSSVFARVEPDIKEQAEHVLDELGIPMSNAIGLFLKQVVLQRGIPFEMKLPVKKPIALGSLTKEQLHEELNRGLQDFENGNYITSEELSEKFRKVYGI